MKTSKKDLAEILGIVAVVASLIFVGMQLQLDRKVAIAEQYASRAESVKEDYRTMLLSPEYFRYVEEFWAINGIGWSTNPDWEEVEQIRAGTLSVSSLEALELTVRLQMVGYDNLYFQYQQGLLDEESWLGLRSSMKATMAFSKTLSDIFESAARANIRPVVEEVLKEIEAEQ